MIFNKLITNENRLIDVINESLVSDNQLLVTYFNQNCFNIYSKNKLYRKLLEEKFLIFSDGIGVYCACRFLIRNSDAFRYNATDAYNKVLNLFSQKKSKIYIIGGNFSRELVLNLVEDKINIIGYHNGYFSNDKLKVIIQEIETLKPDVIMVGMGVPKQEFLAGEISYKIRRNIIYICVGNFFEFYFNAQKRAPLILRRLGMEWLFRLIIEPRRLWKRYLLGIPLFFINILKHLFSSNSYE